MDKENGAEKEKAKNDVTEKPVRTNGNAPEKHSGYRLIKKRRGATVMPEAKYDGAFDKENAYYIRIADKYRIVKYVTVFLTVAFVILMLTFCGSDITAENFQYLIKDLDITGLTSDRSFGNVIYNGGSSSCFGIYRGELAVIDSCTTMLYKPSGAQALSISNDFYDPRLLVSDKYFLVYDRGDTSCSYSVYNSFAELKTESYTHPITLAALSNNGAYAVVTRDDSYRSIVYVYDKDFKCLSEIKKDKYVTALELTDNGAAVAIASVYDKDGDFTAEIMVLDVNADTPDFMVTENGLLPLKVKWMSDGDLCVLYSDKAIVYSPTGEKQAELDLSGLPSHTFAMGEKLIASVYNTTVLGYDKTVKIYDMNAELIYSGSFNGELIAAKVNGDTVCLLFENRVVTIDPKLGIIKEAAVKPNAKDAVFYEDSIVICYSGGAEQLKLEKIPS